MRILVVEDERALASFIEQGLLAEGHAVIEIGRASCRERV